MRRYQFRFDPFVCMGFSGPEASGHQWRMFASFMSELYVEEGADLLQGEEITLQGEGIALLLIRHMPPGTCPEHVPVPCDLPPRPGGYTPPSSTRRG